VTRVDEGRRAPRAPGLDAALSVAALLGVLVVLYLFAARHPLRWDLTRGRLYTLSEETTALLDGLADDIDATAFYKEGDDARVPMKDLLEEYATRSPRFRYRFVDPDRSPGLAREHGVRSYGTTVLAARGGQTSLFTASEAQLTAAILRITRGSARRVMFVAGHGERVLDEEGKEGYSAARDALARLRIEARDVHLVRSSEGLDGVDAVVIAGPRTDLVPGERAALEAYLDGGGALVALVDPGDFPEIAALLGREGIGLGDEIVVDRLSRVFGADILVPVVTAYPETDLTRGFRLATMFPLARPVLFLSPAPPGAERSNVAVTGPGAWGERDTRLLLAERKAVETRGGDREGPLSLAVMTERPAGKGRARVVVFGDSDFADNAYFGASGNGDLFQSAVAWAAGEESPSLIRPRERTAEPLVLTSRQGTLLFWVPVVGVPGAALLAGLAVLARRR
jgi:ABC-type uncharacterized transport system involved in gliding motility auxiliary subunit